MKKIHKFLIYLGILTYLEIVFKILVFKNFFSESYIYIFPYLIFTSLLYFFLTSLFKEKTNKIIFYIIIFFNAFWYAMQFCIHKLFDLFFSFNLMGAADQILEFKKAAIILILENIFLIILFFIPSIFILIFKKRWEFKKFETKKTIFLFILVLMSYAIFSSSLLINKEKEYSALKIYYQYNDNFLAIEKLGVKNSFHLDIFKKIFKFQEKIIISNEDNKPNVNEENPDDTLKYNNLAIDFDLINSDDSTIKDMNNYFKNVSGTFQNKYTNSFNGKNLILIMAESFNEIAVDQKRTPTLYKLVNNGFVFKNFYSPTISSTIGGEFQELTGLYPAAGFLTPFKEGKNYFPFGIGTMFKNEGYDTFAYHNNSYTFQNRHKYLPSFGFDNFKACNNGLEKLMNCTWIASDIEMIDATTNEYLNNSKPFMTFYATVSGHGDYSLNGMISKKYKNLFNEENYSDKVKAYLATQVELDLALELLIKKLTEANQLDNTVIALAGDHYPYYLSLDEVNEVSNYKKDSIIEINRSNLIIWNNKMEKVVVDKVGSQIDILPTLYNLFGFAYDSRLIIGKDILSTEPGLAIFGNRSWVTDYGAFYSLGAKFIPQKDIDIPEDYVLKTNRLASNRITMSGLIITKNYYKSVFGG